MFVSTVKRALADTLRGIVGLDVYAYTPASVVVPCAYFGEVEIDPLQTFGGVDDAVFTLRVLVSGAEDDAGQDLLDDYLSRTGPRSIRAALNVAAGAPGSPALDGAADDLTVTRIDGYRTYVVGSESYFGAELTIRVLGSEA